jgi:hypothetical protein
MDENLNPAGSADAAADVPKLGFFQRLAGVYIEPQKTFEDIGRKGGWLGIFLIMAVLGCASIYILQTRIDHETYIRKGLQANPITKNFSEEQIKAAIERPQGPIERNLVYVMIPIGQLIVFLLISAVFLMIFVIMGGALNFKKSMAVTLWGMAPPGIVAGLLGILFMYIKDPDTLDVDTSANVVSNLGLLVSQKEHPALASLLSSIDIFSFWMIFLLSVGFAAASEGKLTRKKAMTGVVAVWAIYVLGKVGIKAIF